MNAITELENLGYSFTLNGDRIRYTHVGEAPDPALVRPLLAALSQCKTEAIQHLKERAASPDPLYLACQQARYPITFEWPDGSCITYYTPDEAYHDLWLRSMLKEILTLGHSKSG